LWIFLEVPVRGLSRLGTNYIACLELTPLYT
jgi:hypothetical protein